MSVISSPRDPLKFIPYEGPPAKVGGQNRHTSTSFLSGSCSGYPSLERLGLKTSQSTDTEESRAAERGASSDATSRWAGSRDDPIEGHEEGVIDNTDALFDETAAAILDMLQDAQEHTPGPGPALRDPCRSTSAATNSPGRPSPSPPPLTQDDGALERGAGSDNEQGSEGGKRRVTAVADEPKPHQGRGGSAAEFSEGGAHDSSLEAAEAQPSPSQGRSEADAGAATAMRRHKKSCAGLQEQREQSADRTPGFRKPLNSSGRKGSVAADVSVGAAVANPGQEYEFCRITQKRKRDGRIEYLVEWKDSWVCKEDLVNADEALAGYRAKRKGANPGRKTRKAGRSVPQLHRIAR